MHADPPELENERASEQRSRAIFEHASEAMMLADDRGFYLDANPAAAALTGFSCEELRTMRVFDITPAPNEQLGMAMWRHFIEHGEMSGDYALTRKDGSIVEVEFRAVANVLAGTHLSVMRDVTEQRRLERERKAVLEAQSADLARLLRAEHVLAKLGQLLGGCVDIEPLLQRVADLYIEALSDSCLIVLTENGTPGHRAIARRSAMQEGGVEATSRRVDAARPPPASRTGTGTLTIPLYARAQTIGFITLGRSPTEPDFDAQSRDLADEVARRAEAAIERALLHAAVQSELEERKRTEEVLRSTKERLLQAQKMEAIGRLSGGVAHDFNNLLSVILGYSDIALHTLAEADPLRPPLEQIRQAGERAKDLTQQLLAFSRRQVLEPKVVDLNKVVASTVTLLRRIIGEDITICVATDPDLEHVRVDPDKIVQVLMNLAVNARDAMPGGGTLTIRTQNFAPDERARRADPSLPPGRRVRLSVTDTGMGMDDATRARVFEPFFTTKPAGRGTGLGLATVYGIVEQSDGFIEVRSAPNRGSTFDVYLPPCSDAPEAAPQPRKGDLGGTETILLVEDEDQVRRVARMILQTCGYRVIEARNGSDGLRAFEANQDKIALVLTDVVMPFMSGRELAEQVLARRPDMPVLYMSGYTDDAAVRRGVSEASIGFVQKPLARETLAAKVRAALDARVVALAQA